MSDHNDDDGATKSGGGGGGGVFTTMPSTKTNPGSALLLTYLTSKDNDPTPPRCIIEIDASGKETIHTIPKLKRIRCMGCISGAVYLAGYEKEIDVLDLKTGKFTTTIGGGWRHSQVMTTMNNKAYIACGKMFGGHGSGNLCEMDPQTKTYRYFTQRRGWHNAVAITASDDDEKIYAICGRLGGCTGRGGLWEIDMRTPPCKWEKHVGHKIVGHQFSPGGRKIFKTLQEAQTACLWHPSRDARGVTRDGNGNFTVWKGSSLVNGSSGDTSWVMKKMKKPEKPDEEVYPVECGYGNWTCIGQNGTWRHGTAMTYLNGTLFIVSGRRAGTNGTGAIWSVDPKTGKYNRLTSGDGFAMATTLSALRGHLYATCEGKLLKIDPSSGAVSQVGESYWEDVHWVANNGSTSLLYFLDSLTPRAILRAMASHKTSEAVQEGGCKALANLAVAGEPLTSYNMGKEEIAAILRAIKSYKSEAVQEAGCKALANLRQNAECKALANLAVDSSSGRNIWEEGIAAILRAMESHKTSEGLQEQGCGALYNFTCNIPEERLEWIAKAGGIVAILRAMAFHKTSKGVQCRGCGTLLAFTRHPHPRNKKQIVEEGGIAAIIQAMESHNLSEDIQRRGCKALRNLADHPQNQERIKRRGGIDVTLDALRSFPTDWELKETSKELLDLLSYDPSSYISASRSRCAFLFALRTLHMSSGPGPFEGSNVFETTVSEMRKIKKRKLEADTQRTEKTIEDLETTMKIFFERARIMRTRQRVGSALCEAVSRAYHTRDARVRYLLCNMTRFI